MQMTESHIEDEMQDDEFMRDYKDKPGSIPHLPPSSERLLLEAVNSSRIVDIQELVFQRYKYDYIGVSASFIIDWSWEAVYHHSYVLRKDSDALSWASAKVYEYIDGDPIIYRDAMGNMATAYATSLCELFALPHEAFLKAIYEKGQRNTNNGMKTDGL